MIKTVEQYLASLDDGREVWCLGERVKDVRTHPTVSTIVRMAAMDYVLPNHPDFRDLFVTKDADGEDINFLLTSPKTSEDMLRRRKCYMTGMRAGGGVLVHCMGADALAAFSVAAEVMDKKLGTGYMERVENYRRYLQKNDLAITGAITDVKGDRGLRPSQQKQHQDFYLRIVDRQKDGIIVRGAKVHISASPCANELLCLPCRTHAEADKDYALGFAIPVATKGVKLIGVEPNVRIFGDECAFDYPASDHMQPSESLIIFDDVFVPWDRVFMCGEWQYSQVLAYAFASYHRLFGTCKMTRTLETMTGAASLIAEYNGVQNAQHVRKKLSWMAYITETVQMLGKQACLDPQSEFGMDVLMPNRMAINASKWTYASNFHEMCQHMQDIGGGLTTTVPSFRDWKNPELKPFIDKYLAAKDGIPTEDRLRILRLIKDITGNHMQVDTIHGEGSMAAQEMFLYTSADWKKLQAAARRAANMDGWQENDIYGGLPLMVESVQMPPLDESYKSLTPMTK
jgi:4-hydroxybutyryl-CoA dehydratase/vinylacetyl-CoA-Delta-isomerase